MMTTVRGSLIPIRARQASGLNVYVEAGVYWWKGVLKEWAGGTLDISGDVPASSMKCPVICGIDGDGASGAGVLYSYKGADTSTATSPTTGVLFDEATIVDEINNAVASNNYCWFGMVALSDGQTDNDDQDAIVNFCDDLPKYAAAGGGASAFTDLTDTPSSLSGQAGKYTRVNSGETALEFVSLSGGGDLLADGSVPMTADFDVAGNSLLITEQGSTPSTPGTGDWKLYTKSDGLHVLDDAGTDILLGAGGAGGGVATESDTYANRSTAFPSPADGDVFLPTDASIVERYDGTNWIPFGPIFRFVKPVLANFSWTNQGSSTATQSNYSILMTLPTGSPVNARILEQALPSTPWTVTAFWRGTALAAPYGNFGMVLRNSSNGKLITFGANNWHGIGDLSLITWNSVTASFGNTQMKCGMASGYGYWTRIRDDGTTRYYEISADSQTWIPATSHSSSTFITPDYVGMYGDTESTTYKLYVELLSWEVT